METYRDIPYIVHVGPLGSLCAYVRIPDDHKWNELVDKVTEYQLGEHKRMSYNGYDDIPLDVHGGLTFSRRITDNGDSWKQNFTPGAWVGWDYAHCDDIVPGLMAHGLPSFCYNGSGHYWSHEEVTADCKKAIDQMLEEAL